VLGQLDLRPVGRVQHDTAGRVFSQERLQDGQADAVDVLRLLGVEGGNKCLCLRNNAVQVGPGAVAVEQLRFLNQVQAVGRAGIDVACQSRSIIEDLTARLKQVSNGAYRRVSKRERNIGVRL